MTTTAVNREQRRAERPPTDRILRVTPFAVVRATDPGAPENDGLTLDGYAAVFKRETLIDTWEGRFWEQLLPGSMRKTFKEQTPRMQFDHGTHPLIGSIPIASTRLAEEATDPVLAPDGGAHVIGRLFDNWLVEPVRDAIKAQAIDGMSFRMSVVKEEWRNPDGVLMTDPEEIQRSLFASWWDMLPADELLHRSLREVRVPELGPVVWPAYTQTSVGVRSGSVTIDLAAARQGSPQERRKIADLLFAVDNPRLDDKNVPTDADTGGTVASADEVVPGPTAQRAAGDHTEASEPGQPEGTAQRTAPQPPTTRRNEDIALDRIRAQVLKFPETDPTNPRS